MTGRAEVEIPGQVPPDTTRFRSLRDLDARDLAGKVVGLRIDGSLPSGAAREIEDYKLEPGVSTLRRLTSANARVVLISHIDAARNEADERQAAVCHRLSTLSGMPIGFLQYRRGAEVRDAIGRLQDGEALMLGNLALEPAEQGNDPEFARFMADLCDVYCDEAFSLAHQVRASTVGVASMARLAVAGLEFERAHAILSAVLVRPARPFLAVFGGSLTIGRLLLLESITDRSDVVLLGGEICLPFLRAAGGSTGAVAVPDEAVTIAAHMLDDRRTILAPRDFVTLDSTDPWLVGRPLRDADYPATLRLTDADSLDPSQVIADIGVDTRRSWGEHLASARTVLWHGPLGICESPPLAEGTLYFAREILSRTSPPLQRTVVCGELLAALLRASGFPRDRVDYFSPAGSAILHYAACRPLPAVEALRPRSQKRTPIVLLALAGTDDDPAVAEFAASWLPETAAIHCVHVERDLDEDDYPDIYMGRPKSERMAEWRRADRIFASAEAVLAAHGFTPADRALIHGNPIDRLVRRAAEIGADAIVMRDTDEAKRIVSAAPCRVLLLPHAV